MDIASAIRDAADRHGLDPAIVYGVCLAESNLDPRAARYEPRYRWIVRDTRLKPAACSIETEHALQRTSWGLMQVMGAVLREQGFEGWINAVTCNVPAQLEYGCRHLGKAIRRWGLVEGIAAYNSGAPRYADGVLINQYYVDRVLSFSRRYTL